MGTDTRTKNTSRNIVFSMITYFLQVLLGFLARRYFIYYFGEEYLGLSSVFTNVLSFLSLAELGFGTAIVFAMYKPMADKDEEKVRQLLQYYKKSYTIIAIVILIAGLSVMPFMGFLKAQAPNVNVNFYVVYGLFLFNSVISYFFAHRRSLLYTNQRNDIESKINIVTNVLLTSFQLIAICIAKNYYLYVLLIGLIGVVNNLFVFVITQKMFPQYLQKSNVKLDSESKKAINKNIRAMIFHKMGSAVVYSTDSLVIFLMLGSSSLGKYSNYLLITSYVMTIIAIFIEAVRGSVGNSIACEQIEKNQKLLNKLNFIYFWIISFCTISIFILADPFIDIVLTKDASSILTLDKTTLLLICINFYLSQSKYMVGLFKECSGLFYPDRYRPLVEATINLVASIILTKYLGIAGVILGTIISTITTSLWVEPYVLNKNYLKQSTTKYFCKYVFYTIAMLISGIGTCFVCQFVPDGTIWLLLLKACICLIVPNLLLLLCFCWLPEFREVINWGRMIFASMINKRSGRETNKKL